MKTFNARGVLLFLDNLYPTSIYSHCRQTLYVNKEHTLMVQEIGERTIVRR